MDIEINCHSGVPVFRQIIDQILFKISAGKLNSGGKLPTIKELSEKLSVNPNTVSKAYRELELRGIIEGQRGTGSFVAEKVPAVSKKEKKSKVKEICERAIIEASHLGISIREIENYILNIERMKS